MGASSSNFLEESDKMGNDVDLSIYKGKVLLFVNVASNCGFTNVNYTQLAEIYTKYKDQGLEAEFPVFHKSDVLLVKFLKSKSSGSLGSRVKWNFTKFLVDREGRVVGRYGPITPPFAFEKDILNALELKQN
ncbi:hypothetical protein MKX01_014832 [Papaver californicum]|nr:hypothetical protein MKX01_014832 [Papaver californicum]